MEYKLPKDYKKPDYMCEGYISPISVTADTKINEYLKEKQEEKDNCILLVIEETLNVNVDKQELIKALQYDRNQYEKGYEDAKRQYDRGHGYWIEFWDYLKCSNCNYEFTDNNDIKRFNYCPNCGAQMDEEVEDD